MSKKFVIGGGLSGLVYAALHPGYTVISALQHKDMVAKNISPVVLHYDEAIAGWLKDTYKLGAQLTYVQSEVKVRECQVEYNYGGVFRRSLPAALAWQYFMKSRQVSLATGHDVALGDTKDNSFQFFDIDLKVLEVGLSAQIGTHHMISDMVTAIHDNHIETASGLSLEFEHLVSTIPAPVFWRLLRWPQLAKPSFVFVGKQYCHIKDCRIPSEQFPEWMTKDSDTKGYVYYPTFDSQPKHLLRISNLSSEMVAEFTGSQKIGGAYAEVPWAYFLSPGPLQSPCASIEFVGRFAEWDENVLIHDVVKRYL